MKGKLLEWVDPRSDPAETILLDFFVEAIVETREAGVSACHDYVLKEVVTDALIGVLESLYDRAGDALLL